MSTFEPLFDFYQNNFKRDNRFKEITNDQEFYLDHVSAAKCLGLSTERLEHIRQQGQISCCYLYTPASETMSGTLQMYSIRTLEKWHSQFVGHEYLY